MDDEKTTKELLAELIELMNKNDLAELEIEEEGCRIRLRKAEASGDRPVIISASTTPAETPAQQHPPAVDANHAASERDLVTIKSPMVGTFYRASSPDADTFAEAGDPVTQETVVCIIEAMKVMNEIKAECEGAIREILVANGEPVEYGQPLFLIEPA